MIFIDNDFYSNFSSIKEANDDVSMASLFIDQLSNIVAYKKAELVDLFNKSGIKVSENPNNKELSNAIVDNLASNKKLVIGLSYLIAKDNDILQEQLKKGRADNKKSSAEGKKQIDWTKVQDSVQAIAGSMSVVSGSLTGAKKGMFADDLIERSESKKPTEEELAKEKDKNNSKDGKNKWIWVAGAVILIAGIGYYGYKKGWFSKEIKSL